MKITELWAWIQKVIKEWWSRQGDKANLFFTANIDSSDKCLGQEFKLSYQSNIDLKPQGSHL